MKPPLRLPAAGTLGVAVVVASLLGVLPQSLHAAAPAPQPGLTTELVFPLQAEHAHGSTLVELPNGDLLVGWFQGSGERWADDVRIMGARKKKGQSAWSAPFLLADVKEFPDCNPVLFLDPRGRLWLMWITIIANQWETSLVKYRISDDFLDQAGAPTWRWQDTLLLKPGGKTERGIQPNDPFVASVREQLTQYRAYLASDPAHAAALERWDPQAERLLALAKGEDMMRAGRIYALDGTSDESRLGYPYFRRMGWQTRNKPLLTRTGRMIVPLYSDGFSFSLMAYTDDAGENWRTSPPLVGGAGIQPTLALTARGELVAYMRDNGPPPKRLHVSRSSDQGETWSPVRDSELLNSGTACDIVTLPNGHWVLVNNDTETGRHRLTLSLSEDEGKTWRYHKRLADDPASRSHYPAIIVAADGAIHVSYSFFQDDNRKAIKHAVCTEAWIRQ
ncbi:MAG: exo-alpha-sialidase [Opitutaceae bacterium]|nr:exo-alpha-sialidase [Opitutaceae bacterium]